MEMLCLNSASRTEAIVWEFVTELLRSAELVRFKCSQAAC